MHTSPTSISHVELVDVKEPFTNLTFRNHISDHHSYDYNPTNQSIATSSEVYDSIEPTESHDYNWHTANEDSVGLSTTLSTIQKSPHFSSWAWRKSATLLRQLYNHF